MIKFIASNHVQKISARMHIGKCTKIRSQIFTKKSIQKSQLVELNESVFFSSKVNQSSLNFQKGTQDEAPRNMSRPFLIGYVTLPTAGIPVRTYVNNCSPVVLQPLEKYLVGSEVLSNLPGFCTVGGRSQCNSKAKSYAK